jgi:hypothetical protein
MNPLVVFIQAMKAVAKPNLHACQNPQIPFDLMAGPTRLELATSDVTGRRSNQLNYDPALVKGVE